MAERRMFTKKVTDDDNFMALSSSAQALYLHLSMSADDDGFCNQVSLSMFKAHASIQDLQALLEKRYIYQFENGVIVIKHWRMANALRKDRYTPTAFQEELKQLNIKKNGSYTMTIDEESHENKGVDECGCQVVADCLPQVSIGKNNNKQLSDFDLEEAWKKIRDTYPKNRRNGLTTAKFKFLDRFKGMDVDNYKYIATIIARAIDLYKKDCVANGDESFKYVPNMDKWFDETADFWIEKAEEYERKRNAKTESDQ